MSKVLTWVKANVVTVIFLVVMIAAIVALPLLAKSMNADIRQEMDSRLSQKSSLESLRTTQISHEVPGTPFRVEGQGIINESFVTKYEELIREETEDAKEIVQVAIDHNRKDRTVLLDTLFPDPPDRMKDVLPESFHRRLVSARTRSCSPTSARACRPRTMRSVRTSIAVVVSS